MVKNKAIRVRLDLSSISNVDHKLQWAYIPLEKIKTINEFIRHISSKHCLTTKVDHHKIELYLQEPFVLPRYEDIRLLQNGDLITVKMKDESATSSGKCTKVFSTKRQNDSSRSETEESGASRHANLALNVKYMNKNRSLAQVVSEKSNSTVSSSDSSSSSSETSSDEANSNKIARKENETNKDEKVKKQVSPISLKQNAITKHVALLSKEEMVNSSSCSSSDISSISRITNVCSDSQEPSQKTLKTTKTSNFDNLTNSDQLSIKQSDNNTAQNLVKLRKSSTDSSSDSDEPELSKNLKKSPSEGSKGSNLDPQLSELEKHHFHENGGTPVDEKRKRKRKRKRKSKNKNKLHTNTFSQAAVENVVNATAISVTNTDDKEENRLNRSATIKSAEHGSKSHIYFDDDEEEAMECESSQMSEYTNNSEKIQTENHLQVIKNVERGDSCRESLKKTISKTNISSDSLVNPSVKDLTPLKKKKLEPSCRVVSCEEALLRKLESKNNPINGTNICDRLSKQGSTKKIRPALPPILSATGINKISNAYGFEQLLSFAKSSPIRASRSVATFNPVTGSNDIWCNKSIVMQAEESVSCNESNTENVSRTLNVSKMIPFEGLPSVGDRIAFKVFEMSENYTPTMSDFKFGEVKDSSSQTNTVRIKLDIHCINTKKSKDGKFEMPEYDVSNSEKDTECDEKVFQWKDLYEPRKDSLLH